LTNQYLLSKNNSDSLQSWLEDIREFQLDSMFDTNILGRAFWYTDAVSIFENSEHVVKAVIKEKMYELQITSKESKVIGECSCPYDGHCKHLAALLLVLISKKN